MIGLYDLYSVYFYTDDDEGHLVYDSSVNAYSDWHSLEDAATLYRKEKIHSIRIKLHNIFKTALRSF